MHRGIALEYICRSLTEAGRRFDVIDCMAVGSSCSPSRCAIQDTTRLLFSLRRKSLLSDLTAKRDSITAELRTVEAELAKAGFGSSNSSASIVGGGLKRRGRPAGSKNKKAASVVGNSSSDGGGINGGGKRDR